MKRQAFRKQLLLTALIPTLSVASAADFAFEPNADGTLMITQYNGPGGAVKIPPEIDGKPVTAIGNRAFWRSATLTSVVIPDTVTTLQDGNLSAVGNDRSWPSWGHAIPLGAFAGCINLERVTFGRGLTEIGNFAFAGCVKLETLELPERVTRIGDSAFANCTALREVQLPAELRVIELQSFEGCGELAALQFPERLEKIGAWAFQACASLKALDFPDGLLTVDHGAFRHCAGLREVHFAAERVTLGRYVFSGCTALERVRFAGMPPEAVGSHLFFRVPEVAVSVPAHVEGWPPTLGGRPVRTMRP